MVNVVAEETKAHAFWDTFKKNAQLWVKQFDANLQSKLGISWSTIRSDFVQDVMLNRPTQAAKNM
mgnify:CR=1 FL=1